MATKPFILKRNGDVEQRDSGVRLGYLKSCGVECAGLAARWEAWSEWRTIEQREPFFLGEYANRVVAARAIWDDHRNSHSLGFALVDMR